MTSCCGFTLQGNRQDLLIHQPLGDVLGRYGAAYTSSRCLVGLLRQPHHLLEGVHLGIEVGGLEHTNGGVQSQAVDGGGKVSDGTAQEQGLKGLEEVRDTPHLLVLQHVVREPVDEAYGTEDGLGELRLEEGWVNVVLTHTEGDEEGCQLLQGDPFCLHGNLHGINAFVLGKLWNLVREKVLT